jgi:hypothetical protein
VAKAKRKVHIEPLSDEQASALMARVDGIAHGFKGQIDELESALGVLLLGRLFGWRALVLIHNKRTLRKYEEILGIDMREAFPEEGPLAHKSVALTAVKELGEFWKAVSGDVKVENRRMLAQ